MMIEKNSEPHGARREQICPEVRLPAGCRTAHDVPERCSLPTVHLADIDKQGHTHVCLGHTTSQAVRWTNSCQSVAAASLCSRHAIRCTGLQRLALTSAR